VDVWYKDPFIGYMADALGFLFADFVKFRVLVPYRGVKKTLHACSCYRVGNITVAAQVKHLCLSTWPNFLRMQAIGPVLSAEVMRSADHGHNGYDATVRAAN